MIPLLKFMLFTNADITGIIHDHSFYGRLGHERTVALSEKKTPGLFQKLFALPLKRYAFLVLKIIGISHA